MNDLEEARYRQIIQLLKEVGYKRDEPRCQWVRGDYFISDEAIVYLARLT